MSVPISLTTSETASGISVISITRSDNGQSVSGVSLPFDLTNTTGNVWAGSFTPTDATEPTSYSVGFLVTWPDGSTSGTEYASIASGATYTGRYTSETLIIRRAGAGNARIYSDTDNEGVIDHDSIRDAIQWVEDFIDNFFNASVYTVPFVPTGESLPHVIEEWATAGAIWWLYTKRGIHDGDKVGDKWSRIWEDAKKEMRSDRGGYARQLNGVALRGSGAATIVNSRLNRISTDARPVPATDSRDAGVRLVPGYGYVIDRQ